MIALKSLILKPSVEWTKRIGTEDIHFTAISNDRGLPLDIVVRAFAESHRYMRFAQCAIGNSGNSFVANIEIAMQSEETAFLAAVGLHRVLFLDVSNRSIKEPLKLFRAETDDQGFYRMQLHSLPDGFLVNYESGVARLRETGEVVWHRKMVWNDVFVREEGLALLFRNELNPKGFYISVSDGAKSPV